MSETNGVPKSAPRLTREQLAEWLEKFERFTSPEPTSGCLLWTGGSTASGYGVVRLNHPRRTEMAHRLSWEIHCGPIPPGLFVCHRCDNKACAEPRHLFLGTNAENQLDAIRKGLRHPGVKLAEKLTEADVLSVRSALKAGEWCYAIAARLGVTSRTIRDIKKGRSWKRVAG